MSAAHERIKSRLAQKARLVNQLLASPVGQELLTILEEEFIHGPLFDPDPYKSAFNLGGREVVVYLRALRDYNSKEPPNA